jgi:hypothetical protein
MSLSLCSGYNFGGSSGFAIQERMPDTEAAHMSLCEAAHEKVTKDTDNFLVTVGDKLNNLI